MDHPISEADQSQAIKETGARISLADLDDLLTGIQEDVEDHWHEWLAKIDSGDLVLVDQMDKIIVLSDVSGQFWQTEFDVLMDFVNLINADDELVTDLVLAAHTNAALRLSEYDGRCYNPAVLRQPDDERSP